MIVQEIWKVCLPLNIQMDDILKDKYSGETRAVTYKITFFHSDIVPNTEHTGYKPRASYSEMSAETGSRPSSSTGRATSLRFQNRSPCF